ncbi:glycoside hydrolase family 95 protein, partial [bacterium]|nr:glycoside hydrolase family 95 protein [bacterium]
MPGSNKTHSMTMRYPATRWQDALPTGNGTIGALLYGAIHHDTIILNHDALFYPGPRPELHNISDQLPTLRELIHKGHYLEAQKLLQSVHAERADDTAGIRTPYQPFADIRLEQTPNGPFRHYRRGVDFDTGRIWLKWTDEAGTFSREAFVSRTSETVWLRINGNQSGSISGEICLTEHREDPGQESKWFGMDALKWSVLRRSTTDQNMLVFSAELANQLHFGAVARVTADDGQLRSKNDALVFEKTNSVIMQVKLFINEDPKKAIPRLVNELSRQTPDFETAFEAHAQEHKKLFHRVRLNLNGQPAATNETLLMHAYDGEVPTALIQKQYEFGRYLLICSSRPGSWPANLQGIWNGDFYPAWQADIHNDENIQMNYWQALPGNLPETVLPFFDYFEKWLTDYRENAQKIYGCRGIFIPVAQTIHG